jgi:hypothetical protein
VTTVGRTHHRSRTRRVNLDFAGDVFQPVAISWTMAADVAVQVVKLCMRKHRYERKHCEQHPNPCSDAGCESCTDTDNEIVIHAPPLGVCVLFHPSRNQARTRPQNSEPEATFVAASYTEATGQWQYPKKAVCTAVAGLPQPRRSLTDFPHSAPRIEQ